MGETKSKNSGQKQEPSSTTNEAVNQSIQNNVSLVSDYKIKDLVQGLVMLEILGRPRARKWRGNTIWNSRF